MTDLDSGAELHTLIDRTMADVDVPVARLHDTALRRGRSARRRRRAGAALGGLAVAAAVTAVVLPALAGTDSRAGDVATDGGTPPATDATVAPAPSGWWDMPAKVMTERLLDLLPAGLEVVELDDGSTDRAPGEPVGGGWVWVAVADHGAPAGAMNVLLYPPAADDGAQARQVTTCPRDVPAPSTCTEVRDDTGAVVGRTGRWVSGDVVVIEATHLTEDGAVVYAAASNSSDHKWGSGSSTDRRRPAVGAADLERIAADPSWQRWSPRG